MRPSPQMAATDALLVAAPHRQGEDAFACGRVCPDQTPEQPTQFGHSERQQVQPQSDSDSGCGCVNISCSSSSDRCT